MNLMSHKKPYYLSLLRQQHPFMYKVCCCVLLLYFGLNVIRVEVPPIFLSAMYSVPVHNSDTQTVYEFNYNGDKKWKLHEYWNHHKRITFYYTIDFYTKSIQSDPVQAADGIKFKNWVKDIPALNKYADKVYADADDISGYPAWLKNYMQNIIGEDITQYTVLKTEVLFYQNELSVLSSDTIIHFPNHKSFSE